MAQLFPRSSDFWLRVGLIAAVACVVFVVTMLLALARSPFVTGQNIVLEQPIAFSHQHHVADIGIDCRYCHTSVETSANAGMPSTQTCMNCHRFLWNQSDMLRPVRESYRTKQPIAWNRVHDLPDYVYFHHAIHVQKGIGCYSCHGRVDTMPLTRQDQPLTMQWCLDCHRHPEKHIRPARFVYTPQPLEQLLDETDGALAEIRRRLIRQHNVHGRDDCYTCHR